MANLYTGTLIPDLTPFYPPHNRLPRYREPGKININTLHDKMATASIGGTSGVTISTNTDMWSAITNGFPHGNSTAQAPNPTNPADGWWADFQDNRIYNPMRVYAPGNHPIRDLSPTVAYGSFSWNANLLPANSLTLFSLVRPVGVSDSIPTFFRSYRSFAGSQAVPRPTMLYGDGNYKAANPAVRPNWMVDSNLLRRLDPCFANSDPLWVHDDGSTGVSFSRLYRDTNRNPFFRYQLLTKLGGMFTTRSNVYAVWVTVGFFETTPLTNAQVQQENAAGNPTYINTDGRRFTREAGGDVGVVRRHRAFMMVDRTIPVAFQRGETFNADQCIILRRTIE